MTDPIVLTDWTWLLGAAVLGAALAGYARLGARPDGSPAMARLGDRIRAGALGVLARGSAALAALAALWVAVLATLVGPGERVPAALAYVGGVVASAVAAWVGTLAATRANVRSAAAAHESGEPAALRIALWGGAVGGLAAVALGLLGLGALYWTLGSTAVSAADRDRFARAAAALALGVGGTALVARVGGGIFAKAADLAARRVGREDPDNPLRLADQVGDNVGDVAGIGSDLLESAVGGVAATVALAAAGGPYDLASAIALPILALVVGTAASAAALALAPALPRASTAATLRAVAVLASVAFIGAMVPVVRALGFSAATDAGGRSLPAWGPLAALAAGAAAGLLVGLATEYHTAARPVRKVADAAREGPAPALIWGVAAGLESAALPGLLLAGATLAAIRCAGLYGLGLAAVGMVATAAATQAVAASGAITDNANAIGTLSGLPRAARAATDTLGAAGNTSTAVGKGIAGAAATLTALALTAAFAVAAGVVRAGAPPLDPALLAGVLLGAALPFLTAAVVLGGVARAVDRVVRVVREGSGGARGAGGEPPDEARCLALVGRSALRQTLRPAGLALLAPPLVGLAAGPAALAAVLFGAAVAGGLLALALANAGGLWDNAARFIAGGVHGGRGSAAHQAIAVGEALGDPLKDSCAPALSSLIKTMALIALALAPWLAAR